MLTLYLTLATLWTVYMAVETYGFSNPRSRPYFVGFLMTEFVLMPISLALELMTADGYLRHRIAQARCQIHHRTHRALA
jgi:hypothetical protein